MASLYIKDSETAGLAAEIAELRGVTKTAAVRDALREARRAALPKRSADDLIAWLDARWRERPLVPTGRRADKAFYDKLWGED